MAKPVDPSNDPRRELRFAGEADLATLRELIRAVDASPSVTWGGPGGVRGRIEQLIEDRSTTILKEDSDNGTT